MGWGNKFPDMKNDPTYLEGRLSNAESSLAQIASKIIDVKHPPNGLTAAKGDGVTDDTPAINAIVQYVQTNNLGGIYFPESTGNYMINAVGTTGDYHQGGVLITAPMQVILHPNATLKAIPNNQQGYRVINIQNTSDILIQGGKILGERYEHTDSNGAVWKQWTANTAYNVGDIAYNGETGYKCTVAGTSGTTAPTFTSGTGTDGTVTWQYYIGVVGEWGYGISLLNANRIYIKDMTIQNCWGDGICAGVNNVANVCQDIYINNVKSLYNRRQGFSIASGDGVYVSNSEFSYTSGTAPQAGIDIEADPGYINPKNVFISNCKFIGNYTGVLHGNITENVIISNCSFVQNTHSAVEVSNSSIKGIIENNIMDMDSTQGNYGVLITGACTNFLIKGNKIKNAVLGSGIATFAGSNGIDISNNEIFNCKDGMDITGSGSPSFFKITNNSFHDLTNYGIFPNIKLYDSQINDNTFYNITNFDGIYARLSRVHMSGNSFNNIGKRGIGGSDIQECVIANNRFKEMGALNKASNPSLQFDGASSDNYIANNFFRNSEPTHIAVSTNFSTVTIANIITKNNFIYTTTVTPMQINTSDIALDNFARSTPFTVSFTYDPASLSAGTGETVATVAVTGARFGDFVHVAAPYDLQGLTVTAYVSANDQVKVRVQNQTGVTVDLASGTWKVKVVKSTY